LPHRQWRAARPSCHSKSVDVGNNVDLQFTGGDLNPAATFDLLAATGPTSTQTRSLAPMKSDHFDRYFTAQACSSADD